MARPLNWTRGAKLLTGSFVGFMLSLGLCAAGGGFDTHVTQTQIGMSYVGAFLSIVSLILLLSGCAAIGNARRRRR